MFRNRDKTGDSIILYQLRRLDQEKRPDQIHDDVKVVKTVTVTRHDVKLGVLQEEDSFLAQCTCRDKMSKNSQKHVKTEFSITLSKN